jgi:hypothetical protein
MGMQIEYTAFGFTFPEAYVRIDSVEHQSVDGTSGRQRGPLHGRFFIYTSRAARVAGEQPIGSVGSSVATPLLVADPFDQAWEALKAQGEPFASGVTLG